VTQGFRTSFAVTLTPLNGFNSSVGLSVNCPNPSGITCPWDVNPVTVTYPTPSTATLTITTSSFTHTGWYTLVIAGTSGTLTHNTSVTLVVNAPPDFSSSATPSSRTVTQGSNTTYTPTVTALNGFTGSVIFSAGGLPAGASASFSPTSVSGSGSSTITVSTSSTTPSGTYTVTITGTSGGLTHNTSVTLVVNRLAAFSLSVTRRSLVLAPRSGAAELRPCVLTTPAIRGCSLLAALSASRSSSTAFAPGLPAALN
jgi:hypothetical protein